jgi:cytidyltransferase-like protein
VTRVKVARTPDELEPAERAVAIGTFDGVHRGHRAVIEAAKATGLRSVVVTFHPHPRSVLGYEVNLLATLERRIALIERVGPDELLIVAFTPELSRLAPDEFVRDVLEPLGTRVVVAGEGFRFGSGRRGDLALLRRLGLEVTSLRPHASWAARPSSRARSSRATSAAARSASRRRTSPSSRASSSRLTGSMRAPRSDTGRRSRSASTRTTGAESGRSRRTSSTSPATSTARACASSSGRGCATSARSRARRTWSRR